MWCHLKGYSSATAACTAEDTLSLSLDSIRTRLRWGQASAGRQHAARSRSLRRVTARARAPKPGCGCADRAPFQQEGLDEGDQRMLPQVEQQLGKRDASVG